MRESVQEITSVLTSMPKPMHQAVQLACQRKPHEPLGVVVLRKRVLGVGVNGGSKERRANWDPWWAEWRAGAAGRRVQCD